MSQALAYRELPPAPPRADGAGVLARLIDGLAFRYRWATEGLLDEHLELRPCPESMTLGALLEHVRRLVDWVERSVAGEGAEGRTGGRDERPGPRVPGASEPVAPGPGVEPTRAHTLATLAALRALVLTLDATGLEALRITGSRSRDPQPFWCIINGPLADALTHVGQINAWRRIAGIPAPAADVFRGRPPR